MDELNSKGGGHFQENSDPGQRGKHRNQYDTLDIKGASHLKFCPSVISYVILQSIKPIILL